MTSRDIPGWEGSIGPFPSQYGQPHVYARDIHSGAGNCVCGAQPGSTGSQMSPPSDRFDPPCLILDLRSKTALTCDISARSGPRRLLGRHPVPDSVTPLPPGVRAVPLGGKHAHGRVAWVDERNYDRAIAASWSVQELTRQNGTINGPYALAHVPGSGKPGRNVLLHNYITGRKHLDHRNGDGLDCRESNLRDATQSQNGANCGKLRGDHWSSRYKGVCWFKPHGMWRARIRHQNTWRSRYFPGTPEGEIAAARTYDDLAWELFGEFAWLNRDHFPEVRQ